MANTYAWLPLLAFFLFGVVCGALGALLAGFWLIGHVGTGLFYASSEPGSGNDPQNLSEAFGKASGRAPTGAATLREHGLSDATLRDLNALPGGWAGTPTPQPPADEGRQPAPPPQWSFPRKCGLCLKARALVARATKGRGLGL